MSTDPTALAREVLDAAHEDETVTVCSIPDNKAAALARAVIELTAELVAYREENTRHREERARVEALADDLDREADRIHVRYMDMGDHAHGLRDAYREDAKRIRAALNGENA